MFIDYNLLNLKQQYTKELVCNIYYLNLKENYFNHSYETHQKINNTFRIILKLKSEFVKRDPFNIGSNICNQPRINISVFQNFKFYEKFVKLFFF